MNYYEIRLATNGKLIAKGNALECKRQLGCSSLDTFYSLASRSMRGINKKYNVIRLRGGDTTYPVLGKNDPIYKMKEEKANE